MINFVAIVHVQTALKLAQTAAQHLHLVVTPNALIVCPLSVCLSVSCSMSVKMTFARRRCTISMKLGAFLGTTV